MTRHGPPTQPRSSLDRGTRSPTNDTELQAMRTAAWHRQGVAVIPIDDITDPWLRQAITNEANRRWGRRSRRTPMAGKRKAKRTTVPYQARTNAQGGRA